MENIYIIQSKRTPVGSFQGAFSSTPAPLLGGAAIRSVIEASGLKPENIDECIMGEVLTAGVGQAPARQAAIAAGLPVSVPCLTINKVCGSGLKAVMLARDSILTGQSQIVVAGGQENMTLAPHLLENSRAGYRMGHVQTTDSMIKDGLWDPYSNWHMGNSAELCVREYKFSREAQDQFAIESYELAQKAQSSDWFKDEICSLEVSQGRNKMTVAEDEEPKKARFDKIPELRPAFEKEGTITAANASKINDGGAALILASEKKVKELGLKPQAKIIAQATFSQDPKWFTTAPVGAMKKALNLAQLTPEQIDFWEINEAFSVVTLAAMKEFNIPRQKVNVHGGAVAIGHPLGASGARILTTLLHALKRHNKKYGIASLCIGGGEAVAVIIEAQ
jgi:acetyl-CoA C-acetyltransferase